MKIRMIASLLTLVSFVGVNACPFTLTNDKKVPYMILAWGTGSGIYLAPGQTEVVEPRKVGGEKESKLYFYEANGKKLEQKMTLIQMACAINKDETKLKISDVEKMIRNPGPRIKVEAYKGEGMVSKWWNKLKKQWNKTMGSSQEPKKVAEKKSTSGKAVNGNELKKAADKCEQKPSEQQEQCYFEVAKTMTGDVLATGNYE